MVPTLDEMRGMTDAELLELKTDLSYDMASIESQIRFSEQSSDPDWLARAGAAQHIRQHGVAAIKNILMERQAQRRATPAISLVRWMDVHNTVAVAARALLDDDDDEQRWEDLQEAIQRLDNFTVTYQTLLEATL
jgi:hypothetical protein